MAASKRSRTLCVVPCYNQAPNLPAFMRDLEASGISARCDLLFVDDGSTDGTAAMLVDARCLMLRHDRNRGYGAAVKSGVGHCIAHGYENMAVMPSDNQRTFADLEKLVHAIESGRCDVVIGSKLQNGQHIPPGRWLGNLFFSRLAKAKWGATYRDVLSGFKAYRVAGLAPFVDSLPDGYEYDLMFSHRAKLFDLRTEEIPVGVRYHGHSTRMRSTIVVGLQMFLSVLTAPRIRS
jgi:glycosyltransferase involved in cell wall biosynthesis